MVFRNPEEALVSAKPFLEKHTDEWYELWQVPKGALTRPDFSTFYYEVLDAMGMHAALFGSLRSWWPLRNKQNVLFLHFADMKKDHEGAIRKIADFIGARPTDEEWSAITEYASFPWMKQNGIKFDASTATDVPVLAPGAMVRKGESDSARGGRYDAEDLRTPACDWQSDLSRRARPTVVLRGWPPAYKGVAGGAVRDHAAVGDQRSCRASQSPGPPTWVICPRIHA